MNARNNLFCYNPIKNNIKISGNNKYSDPNDIKINKKEVKGRDENALKQSVNNDFIFLFPR
ncbi:MAG: hypothetical protein ACO3K7_04535 [Candidatus Marinamargulisbacteria bacterium]